MRLCNGDDNTKIHDVLQQFGYERINKHVATLRHRLVNDLARSPRESDPVDWVAVQMALARDNKGIRAVQSVVRNLRVRTA